MQMMEIIPRCLHTYVYLLQCRGSKTRTPAAHLKHSNLSGYKNLEILFPLSNKTDISEKICHVIDYGKKISINLMLTLPV